MRRYWAASAFVEELSEWLSQRVIKRSVLDSSAGQLLEHRTSELADIERLRATYQLGSTTAGEKFRNWCDLQCWERDAEKGEEDKPEKESAQLDGECGPFAFPGDADYEAASV